MPTKLQTLIAIARFTVITLTVAALVSCGGGGSGGQPSDRDDDRLTQDATKPVITLIGPTQVTIAQGTEYNDPGATASDNIDGSLTPVVSGTLNSIPGDYILTYTATDSSGNSETTSRTVTVIGSANVINNGVVDPAWDYDIQGFDEKHANGLSGVCSNGGDTCPSLSWELVSDDQRGNVLQLTYAADAGHAGV